MWLKMLLCILLVAFCTLFGHFAAGKYRARSAFFSQLYALNESYLKELRYSRKPLPLFLKENWPEGDLGKLLMPRTGGEGAGEEKTRLGYLTGEERADVQQYLSALGRGDALSQQRYFEGRQKELSEKRAESEREAAERSTLYKKLGFLLGLALVILVL